MACKLKEEDRLSRIVAGVILLGFTGLTGNPVGWLGLIPLVTGIVGRCPLYKPLGIDPCAESGGGHH